MSPLYFNEESDYSEENTCGNKVFSSTLEQKIQIGANTRSNQRRCFAKKKVFLKMSQNSQEAPVPEKTPMNFAKLLGATFCRTTPGNCF